MHLCMYTFSDSVAQKLMLNTTEQPGFSLLRQSPEDWQVYYVDVYGCSPQQNDQQENPPPSSSGPGTTHLLKYVIRSSEHKFRITGKKSQGHSIFVFKVNALVSFILNFIVRNRSQYQQ